MYPEMPEFYFFNIKIFLKLKFDLYACTQLQNKNLINLEYISLGCCILISKKTKLNNICKAHEFRNVP